MKTIEITGVIPNKDPETLGVKLSPTFKAWFCEVHNLKRWSHKKFQKVLFESLITSGLKISAKKVKVEVLES